MSIKDNANKSFSSTLKWTYVPGKVYTPPPPLDINQLRKQLLESDPLEEESECEDTNDENLDPEKSDTENTTQKPNTEIICDPKTENNSNLNHEGVILEPVPEDETEETIHNKSFIEDDKENTYDKSKPMNLSRKKNDSFDLDFSAMSVHTPLKQKEKQFNYITPKINIIPPSETKCHRVLTTPKVNNFKTHLFNQPVFKTPVNKPLSFLQYSATRRNCTPYNSVKKPEIIPEIHDIVPNPVSFFPQDDFDRLAVNEVEYIVMNLIGKGGSSEVFHCFNSLEKIHVAIKVVSLAEASSAEGYINEIKLLKSLQKCDKIIKMYDYEIRDEKLFVVLEKGGEDLNATLKHLATKQSHLPTYMLLFYWLEMLYAVQQIHSNGVIHSDLKPANFIRAEGGLKLIDFGIASKVQEDMTCVYKSNQEGSCNYISPEALNLQTNRNVDSPSFGKSKYKIHFKSDVWSLGCILYQLVYRRTPFQHINQIWAKLAAITDPKHTIQYPKADWVSPRIVDSIRKCLQYDIKSRPSVQDLIEEYEQLLKKI